jgi:hypothetical protein
MKVYVGPLNDRGKRHQSYLITLIEDLKHLKSFTKYELVEDNSLRSSFHDRTVIFKIDDKLILLDGNNKSNPSYGLLKTGILSGYSLVIKLQYTPSNLWSMSPIPITAWTFTERFNLVFRGSYDKYQAASHEHKCGFIGRSGGKIHKDRADIVLKLNGLEGVDCEFWHHKERHARTLTCDEYLKRVLNWKSALIPPGTVAPGNDGKTWREIECAALGMPMILDKPRNYWVDLKPFEHYIPIDGNIDGAVNKAIEDKDLGRRAREWYKKAASTEGVCRTFAEILERYL